MPLIVELSPQTVGVHISKSEQPYWLRASQNHMCMPHKVGSVRGWKNVK